MTRGNAVEYRHHIPAGPGSTVVHTRRSNDTVSTYYTTADHLGSGTVTMDSSGATLVNLSFGAFGKRRGAAWNDVPSTGDWTQITATGRDGFTGHEHLDNVGAIHMNGRVYDPTLGRFLSADPVYVGDLTNPQSLNPYSYVGNRPLSATDPSGYWGNLLADGGFPSIELPTDSALSDLNGAISGFQRSFGTWAASARKRSFGSSFHWPARASTASTMPS